MPGTGSSALWVISFNPQQPQSCEVLLSLFHFTEVRLPAQTTTGRRNPICGTPKASLMMTTLHCLSEQKLERRLHKTQERIAPASAGQSFPSSRSLLLVEDRLDTALHTPGLRNGSTLLGSCPRSLTSGEQNKNINAQEILSQPEHQKMSAVEKQKSQKESEQKETPWGSY